jgi:hypothetical protein
MRYLEAHELKFVVGGFASSPEPDPDLDLWDEEAIEELELISIDPGECGNPNREEDSCRIVATYAQAPGQQPSDIPDDIGFRVQAGLISAIFTYIGVNTGYDPATGYRYDGLPNGSGCGDKSTDMLVPDSLWGIDLTAACVAHDQNYGNQIGKAEADNIFKQDVRNSAIGAGAPQWAAELLAFVYFTAVSNLGGDAYQAAGQGGGNPSWNQP